MKLMISHPVLKTNTSPHGRVCLYDRSEREFDRYVIAFENYEDMQLHQCVFTPSLCMALRSFATRIKRIEELANDGAKLCSPEPPTKEN